MAKTTAKETILVKGARLIHENGYNNTGLQQILSAAGVPKGSFYFYFKSKEEFGLQVIDIYADFIRHMTDTYLSDTDLPPLLRLENLLDGYMQHFQTMNLRYGCPIGNLMQEMSDLSEAFRTKICSIYYETCSVIAQCIRQGQESGEILPELDADETAQFIFNCWEGSVTHMKLVKSTEPLITFKKIMLNILMKHHVPQDTQTT